MTQLQCLRNTPTSKYCIALSCFSNHGFLKQEMKHEKVVFIWQFTSVVIFNVPLALIEDTKHKHVWEGKGVEDKTYFYLHV